MTMAADALARLEMAETYVQDDFKYNGEAIRNMVVMPISVATARKYIASFHYSHVMPDSTSYAFGGFLGGVLRGVVCYGVGATKGEYTSLIADIKDGEYLELTRLWCAKDFPRNTESKLISASLKLLPPQIRLVVSFADSSINHCGIIYQATNWYYCGMSKGGKAIVKDGVQNRSKLLSVYKMRHPDEYGKMNSAELAKSLGYEFVTIGQKHRYVYLRGTKRQRRKMYEEIKQKIQPYPKCNKNEGEGEAEAVRRVNAAQTQTRLF